VAWKRKRIASGDGLFEAALEFDILPRKMAAKRSMEGCGRAAVFFFFVPKIASDAIWYPKIILARPIAE
jgi:hypothetical protein